MNTRSRVLHWLNVAGSAAVLVAMCVIFSLAVPRFASPENIRNILLQISVNTTLAVGMTFVILVAGIDLSVGSVLTLATVATGSVLLLEGISVPLRIALGIGAGIGVGAFFGLINGFVSERWEVPAFVTTLATMGIARGVALLVTNSRTLFGFPQAFLWLGNGTLFWNTLPVMFITPLVLVVVGQFILSRTVFGRYVMAIGNNEEAARLSGIPTSFYKTIVYVICGITAGIAGISFMARLSIANPILGVGDELTAIAATVIGGTSLAGGRGSVTGSFVGACIVGVLDNALILLRLSDFVRQIITGVVIIVAVILDSYRRRLVRLAEVTAGEARKRERLEPAAEAELAGKGGAAR